MDGGRNLTFNLTTGLQRDDGYTVKLESFEGPLDLLLYLIKKNEIDIYDIPIAFITRHYLEHISLMKQLNLEIAGDFLVMAATLIQIKAALLLPRHAGDEVFAEEEEDPRAELVRRLLEYQRYRQAAEELATMTQLDRDVFGRTASVPELPVSQDEGELADVGLFELIAAFQHLLVRAPSGNFHEVDQELVSIADRINEVLAYLHGRELVGFDDLFPVDSPRSELVVTFLAILELCRLRMVRIFQVERHGAIHVAPAVAQEFGNVTEEVKHGTA